MHFFPLSVLTFMRRALLTACAMGAVLALHAVNPATLPAAEQAPINIEANRMVSQENSNSVVFMGKVMAKQGAMTIRTDEMTVYYSDSADGNKAAGQLEKLVCIKNVQIVQDDWLGTGDRLDYFARQRKAVLSGNAKAWNGPNMVSGKTITYYLDEKRSVVEQDPSQKGRVRAVIRPGASQ